MVVRIEDRLELEAKQLGWCCPSEWVDYGTTADIDACQEIFGQPRAVAALRLALRLRARDYNVFVAGASGTGRTRTVRRVLMQEKAHGRTPDDLCYVVNFEDPRAPRLLRLPAGKGRVLREALTAAADRFRQGVAALRASGTHRRRREAVLRGYLDEQAKLLSAFQEEIAGEGFALVEVNLGPYRRHDLAPVVENQPVPFQELSTLVHDEKISEEDAARLIKRHPELAARLAQTAARYRGIARELEQELAAKDRDAAQPLVDEVLGEVEERLQVKPEERPGLGEYLDTVREFLLAVFPLLFSAGERVAGEAGALEQLTPDPLAALQVNVIVDRTGQEGMPIVEESNPTASRLFGFVDVQRTPDGELRADLSGIRAGSYHQADGGFLLINAHDMLVEEGAWTSLRRAMRSGMATIAGAGKDLPSPLMPEEAPIDATVILVGTPALRDAAAREDGEFNKLFKVVSVFEERVPLAQESVRSYSCFLAHVIQEEGLLPHRAEAVARILESMVRLAGSRDYLSTHLRIFTDLARESSWTAQQEGADEVRREHVEAAFVARRERSGLMSSRILESIEKGLLHLETQGERIGQINALAVVESSLERMGYPSRVTATTAVGRAGIIDIEREAELSGEIHTKASLILGGFLRSRFAQRQPLAITASICFEQSYGGIEGDSASCAELIALLSSIAEAPIRQDLAMTGAVDQHGNVLAVGGVNEKVEGFWRVCRSRGLTGTQGVALPATSVESLQLLPELVDDVRAGRFHVYAARRIEELVELMLGVPFGREGDDGRWVAGSLGARVAARIQEMASLVQEFGPDCQF